MTTGVSWNRIITVASAFGIPALGLLVSIVIMGTKLVDKVETFGAKQDKQDIRIDKMSDRIDLLNVKMDTITTRQERNIFITNNRFEMIQGHRQYPTPRKETVSTATRDPQNGHYTYQSASN